MLAKAMVVDDDPQILDCVVLALDDEGYSMVRTAGRASLVLARTEQPNLILLDIFMPDMDGAEVSRRLRAGPATREIPIVAMSAHRTAARLPTFRPTTGWPNHVIWTSCMRWSPRG